MEQISLNPGYFETLDLIAMGIGAVGQNVKIARNCTIVGLEQIFVGSNVRIDGPTTIVVSESAKLILGSFIHVGGGCHINASNSVELMDFSGLSQGVRIYSSTDDYSGNSLTNPMVPNKYKTVKVGAIKVGRHVIIGSGSIIMPNVEIGEGSCVGALSLVVKSLDQWGMFAGVPAVKIKDRSRKLLELEQDFIREQKLASNKNY